MPPSCVNATTSAAHECGLSSRLLSSQSLTTPSQAAAATGASAASARTGRSLPHTCEYDVWPFLMEKPVLNAFVRELAEHEKLAAFADDLPQRARVSEAALPVVLASLHTRLARPLVCLVPEDVDARDTADAVSWYLGDEPVGTLPSRGVSWESGLEPPPHLVGERARALRVLAEGGIVVASARGLAEPMPPAAARPAPLDLQAGAESGVEGLAEELALAGYARVA